MSPVSRGRKPKKKAARKKSAGNDERREAFKLVLREFEDAATSDDALDVELLIAGNIGSWWVVGQPDESEREFGFPLIDFASTRKNPAALGLLRATQALGLTEEQRTRAGAAAESLVRLGVPEPPWADGLREVTVSECWQEADVYGDGTSLLFMCDRAGRRHGLVVDVDFVGDGVEDVFLTGDPDDVLREMRQNATDNETLVTEQLSLPRGRRIVEDAMALNDSVIKLFPAPVPQDPLTEGRALVMVRLRAMPPADHPSEPTVYSDADRDDIVREFLAESTGVKDDLDNRQVARMIVDFGCDEDHGRPLRVGPGKLEAFVEELEYSRDIEEEAAEVLPDVVRHWAKWAGERSGLSTAAIEEMLEEIDDIVDDFRDTIADEFADDLEDDFADDLDDDLDEGDGDIPPALRPR